MNKVFYLITSNHHVLINHHLNRFQEQDTSFGSEGLPVGLDNTMNGLGDPLPMGDEVSEGRLSEARDLPTFDADGFQCNTIHHGRNSPCPSPKPNLYPSGAIPSNPNRVTGIDKKGYQTYGGKTFFFKYLRLFF